MFALIAAFAFVLSPFFDLGPWPLVTVGLFFVALHLVWSLGIPGLPPRNQ